MNFNNKNVMAPMVRVTTLPMRILALRYGADYVYSEEIIDFKIIRTKRVINEILGTVDFISDDGIVVFRTCAEERHKIIFQMGTSNPQRALQAAKIIENDVAAIDINMGCPKEYSTKGGMGAALLRKPDLACEILKTLSENLSIPVTCKIRILKTNIGTLEFINRLTSTGVKAISIHGRYTDERPRQPVHDDVINLISQKVNDVTIIANGGSKDFIKTYDDIEYFKQCCGTTSVMIGRAAMWNPTIFKDYTSLNELPPKTEFLIQEYLKLAFRYDNYLASTKYCISQLLHDNTESPGFKETIEAVHMIDFSKIWSLSDFYLNEQDRRALVKKNDYIPKLKMIKLNNYNKYVNAKCKFIRRLLGKSGWSPKLALVQYCIKNKWDAPLFNLTEDKESRQYFCSIVLKNCFYTNEIGDKNKKFAEQAISCICLNDLGLISNDITERGLVIEQCPIDSN